MKFCYLGIAGLLLSLTFGSCKKDISLQDIDANAKTEPRYAGDNMYDLLGFGYDVTKEYASSNSSTYKVIDIAKLAKDAPDRVVPDLNVSQYAEYNAGGNAAEYSRSLSMKHSVTVKYLVFGGTLDLSFKSTGTKSSKYSYASASQYIRQKRLKFDAPRDLIKSSYLTSVFKSDVASMSPQQLVSKYGTHILSDIILGAKLNVYYKSENYSANKTLAVEAGLKTNGLIKVFGFSTEGNTQDTYTWANSNYNQTLYYTTVGGDGSKGLFGEITLDNSAPKVNIAHWQSSCTRDNAALIQIGYDGFIPLNELISDQTKSTAVKNYIDQYLKNAGVVVAQEPNQGSLIPQDWESRAKLVSTAMPSGTNLIFTSSLNPALTSNGNNTIYSSNSLYKLVLQSDGDLVLSNSSNKVLWKSNSGSSQTGWTYRLHFQQDGNLVIKKVSSSGVQSDIWASYTEARAGTPRAINARRAYISVQNDGNVAFYYNGYDGNRYSLEYSTDTYGGKVSSRFGRMK